MNIEGKRLADVFTSEELKMITYDFRMTIVNIHSWLEGAEINPDNLEYIIKILTSLTEDCTLLDKYH